MSVDDPKNEGEGSQTGAKAYNEKTKQFVEKQDVDSLAEEAAAALEGSEGAELREAEEKGRSRARGEDPQINRDK